MHENINELISGHPFYSISQRRSPSCLGFFYLCVGRMFQVEADDKDPKKLRFETAGLFHTNLFQANKLPYECSFKVRNFCLLPMTNENDITFSGESNITGLTWRLILDGNKIYAESPMIPVFGWRNYKSLDCEVSIRADRMFQVEVNRHLPIDTMFMGVLNGELTRLAQ